MQVLSEFRRTSRIGILKTVIKVGICCAVVFYEEINAVHFLNNLEKSHDREKRFSSPTYFCQTEAIY